MNVLKTVYAGLLLLFLATAVPVAAIAIDISATSTDGATTQASKQIRLSATAPQNAALVIRHQTAHCHTWSFNGSGYAADQTAQLAVGDSMTVKNNDVMSHQLVELSGPAATITTSAMTKPGATSQITFSKPGTYLLGTKPGEDWAKGVVTTGADNVLRMTVVVLAPGAPAPQNAALVIRHQKAHCHAWSFDGSGYAADQTAQLAVGDSMTVKNLDVMSHQLVELSGPAATITTSAMTKPGATAQITFSKPGTYLLGTKPGEDYTKGIVTTGADNVLRMTVHVS
jgi:plastocyanin